MTEHPHNDRNDPVSAEELDEYLDGESPVSAAYHDLDPAEPPEALDNAILREARNEVFASGDTVGIGGFWQRWMRPLGTVAAMAFCLALVLQVLDQEPAALLDNVPAESEVLLYETRERTQEEVKKETDIYRYSASPPPVAEQPPPGRADLAQDSFGVDSSAGLAAPSPAPERPAEIQETVVMNRAAEEQLQDKPVSARALSQKSVEEA
ncbi:MAG: hypothetical protein QGF91_06475, partial [Gammaproteobacteria bacterium]|nr:hypothetical protein [Gammaproteobacteria bacterium]